jgi:hypothetical protein
MFLYKWNLLDICVKICLKIPTVPIQFVWLRCDRIITRLNGVPVDRGPMSPGMIKHNLIWSNLNKHKNVCLQIIRIKVNDERDFINRFLTSPVQLPRVTRFRISISFELFPPPSLSLVIQAFHQLFYSDPFRLCVAFIILLWASYRNLWDVSYWISTPWWMTVMVQSEPSFKGVHWPIGYHPFNFLLIRRD